VPQGEGEQHGEAEADDAQVDHEHRAHQGSPMLQS
jgi:hypothetical protein